MSDIVERLRKTDPLSLSATLNTHDAIAEIERLRAALQEIAERCDVHSKYGATMGGPGAAERARRALEQKP